MNTAKTAAWARAIRCGFPVIVLGIACWVVSLWAIEDLHALLVWVGLIMVALGLLIIVASERRFAADDRRVAVLPESRSGT